MREHQETKKEILNLAEGLLRDRGFNGFSYKHISSALDVKNAAVHYHYPTKSDLGVAIIQRARRGFQKWTQNSKMQNLDFPKKLDEFFGIYRYFLKCGQHVCLGGALETDFKTLPIEMQQETRALASDILNWLQELLKKGREAGSFSFPGNPRDQAIVVLSSLQGALQMVRATDPSYLNAAMKQIERMLKT
jgi:TetR/AcrR family transcriptional repressor of nem operon